MSNYEKIKSMSIEEMACFLLSIHDFEYDETLCIDGSIIVDTAADVMEWLKNEERRESE